MLPTKQQSKQIKIKTAIKHILIIEAERIIGLSLTVLLEVAGYKVHPVKDCLTAINLIEKEHMDLIIADLDNITGDDCEKLRLVISAHALSVIYTGTYRGKKPLRAPFFAKPYNEHEIKKKAEEMIGN